MAALVVTSHREDETAALAAVESRTAARAEVDRKAPRRVRPRRSLSPARANRLRSVPSGQRSRRPRLVELEPLEVAEYDRQAEHTWQILDLGVEPQSVFPGDHRLIGHTD